MDEHTYNEEIKGVAKKFKSIVDKLRVRSHLANMEAKDSLEMIGHSMEKLSRDLTHLKYELKQERDETNLTFHLGLMEARQRWGEILEYLNPLLRSLNAVNSTLDHAKIQAHLAMMDSKDAYEDRKAKILKMYRNKITPKYEELLKSFKKDLEDVDKHL